MAKARITGTGSYLPKRVLTNDDLASIVDTSDEWIVTRTGMKERRIAAEDEYTSDMGFQASLHALEDAQITADQIDLILCATLTPDYVIPSTACLLQALLKANNAAAIDIQAACTGFIYCLSQAKAYIEAGMYKNILVVATEKLSSIVNYKDRNTCILFGDGASACIVSASGKGLVVRDVSLGADGEAAELIILPAGGSRRPASLQTVADGMHFLQMDGKEVFKHAVRRMEWAANTCLERVGLTESDIHWLIPHQANARIIEALAKRFNAPMEKVFMTIHKYGNTSASSVGIALDELIREHNVSEGTKSVTHGFWSGIDMGSESAHLDKRGGMMAKRWAFLFPGQGAQYVGMGRDFYETFPVARQTFQEADDLLGEHLSRLIFTGDPAELTLTKNSQVAIFVVSIAILRALQQQFPLLRPSICAGLSLGEYTALIASEKIPFADCLQLVKKRAVAMHEACLLKKGVMQVVLGLTEEEVSEAIQTLDAVWIANINCPGQVVIAGAEKAMSSATEVLKAKGAKRILPLEVSGAFHSGLMRPAQEKLEPEIARAPLVQSAIDLVMNVPGEIVRDTESMRRYLSDQVVSPVRWEKGVRTLQNKVEGYLEIGPGKILSGMNKRIQVPNETVSVEKVIDFDQLEEYATISS